MRILISILMLVVLGVSVGASVFAESHQSTEDRCQDDEILGHHQDPLGTSNKHCHDPCHLGLSHFGHSSALIQDYSIDYKLSLRDFDHLSEKQSLIKPPDLDGFRRPPRLA